MNDTIERPTETIMIIESDVLTRMVIADYLRDCGYRVIEGTQPSDVLELLEASVEIDTVFLDARQPGGIDGFTLSRRVHETYPHVKVVLNSGLDSAANKAHEICGQGPATTPYHPQEVLRRIHMLRERRRTAQ